MIALAMMIAASAFMAATSLIAKMLGNSGVLETDVSSSLHPFQITAGRFAFVLLTISLVALINRPNFRSIPWHLHVARSTSGYAGVTLLFAAAIQLPLADATAISFLSLIVTMMLAVPLLGERFPLVRIGFAGIAFAGALVLIRPGLDSFQPAALLALAAALALGLETIFIKRLSDREPAIRLLLINNLIGCLVALPFAMLFWITPTADQWILLVALGLCMACVQALFIQAMKRAPAAQIVPYFYATLGFAALYDWLVFETQLGVWSLLGVATIASALIALNFHQRHGA